MTIRLLLCDDQALVRAALRKLLDEQDDFTVVGEAGDGVQTLQEVRRLRPDVTLMEMNMPRCKGVDLINRLTHDETVGTSKVVILTTVSEVGHLIDVLRAGAKGILLKNNLPSELVSGIRAVAAGEAWLTPAIAHRLISYLSHNVVNDTPCAVDLSALTNREKEVLHLISIGFSNAQIADALVVGEATVKSHVSNLLRKLSVRTRVQAAVFARNGSLAVAHPPRSLPKPAPVTREIA